MYNVAISLVKLGKISLADLLVCVLMILNSTNSNRNSIKLYYSKTRRRLHGCGNVNTVGPEILAGRYFGGLLKIYHLAEFTLAVESVLAIMIFIAKWLIEHAGNSTGP